VRILLAHPDVSMARGMRWEGSAIAVANMRPKLLIPEFFCGTRAAVSRNAIRVVRQTISHGSLSSALASKKFCEIEDAPGQIILDQLDRSVTDEHVLLEPFGREFSEQTCSTDRGAWYELNRKLLWDSLDEFWMCLAVLGDIHLLPIKTPFDAQRPNDCRYILSKLLNWWPEFCRIEDRFYDGVLQPQPGYRWARSTWDLLYGMGKGELIAELKELDAQAAGERMKDVVGWI
jgi:hypothetical protein